MINKYPFEVQDALIELGASIADARKSRSLTQQDVADRSGLGRTTIIAIEKGSPDVAMGNYMSALWGLNIHPNFKSNLEADINEDTLTHLKSNLPRRVRK
ncbi:helix-turn-helix domain-containing protein [Methylotenera sp.]|uniref:helix-turn-helix domain-containing protein n=1 Tax=Methylotenera sp. TaxID=2051956 RepID=UPI0025FA21C1|nr:helix-turn-helix domain-containing protein [Methylotenera sp.]